jgi:hypothetical protein
MTDDKITNVNGFNKTSEKPKVEDTRTVAEKDSTHPEHTPPNVAKMGGASYSPMGTVPVKTSREVNITVTSEEMPSRDIKVGLDRADVNVEYENKGFNVLVRRDDVKSDTGIEDGHISRLTLTKGEIGNEEIHAHYDDGKWVKEPSTFLAKQAVMEAKKQDNGITMPSIKPAFTKSHDPDIDI